MRRKSDRNPVAASAPLAVPGVVFLDALYRADEAKARMGWRDAAWRAACRRGLRVHRCGKRGYVTGVELLRFVAEGGDV
jgi:hypothetical protein